MQTTGNTLPITVAGYGIGRRLAKATGLDAGPALGCP